MSHEERNKETTPQSPRLPSAQETLDKPVLVVKEVPANDDQTKSTASSEQVPGKDNEYPIIENSMVEVLPRTWPGVNKIGGIARVTKCYYYDQTPSSSSSLDQHDSRIGSSKTPTASSSSSDKPTHVDVRYVVMGGREKMVPLEYCRPAPQYDHTNIMAGNNATTSTSSSNNGDNRTVAMEHGFSKRMRLNLRDRSSLLGRCKLCGSLRSDCGSCDWVAEEKKRRLALELQNANGLETNNDDHNDGISNAASRRGLQYKRRRRRRTKMHQENEHDDIVDNDSLSFEDSHDYHDDYDDYDDDESYFLHNRRVSRNTTSRVFSSSSSSSSSPSDSSSDDESSSEDDQVLAKLNEKLTNVNLKRMKQRVKQIAKLSNSVGNVDGAMKRKKRLKRKYMQSDARFRARMSFLNQRLESVSRYKQQQQQQDGEKRYTANQQLSVLERIGKPEEQHDSGRNGKVEEEAVENVENDTKHVGTKRKSEGRRIPIPSFSSPSILTEDQELNGQESMESSAINDNLSKDGSKQNQGLKIGFVDGDDIGEKESDEDHEFQDDNDEMSVIDNGPNQQLPLRSDKDNRMDAIQGYYEDGLGMNTFIQPEGELVAENLPSDMIDRSKYVDFSELPKFFEAVVDDLTKVLVPKYKSCVDGYEKEFDVIYSSLQRGRGSVDNTLLKIQKKCRELYDEMCVVLVRDGTDQCRCALKRFGKRKEYRMATIQLPKNEWKELVENLDLKFDAVDDEVETLLQRARSIVLECADAIDFYSEYERGQSNNVVSSRNRSSRKIKGNYEANSSSRSNYKHQYASRSKRPSNKTSHLHSQSALVSRKRNERGQLMQNESSFHIEGPSENITNCRNSSLSGSFDETQGASVRRSRSKADKVGEINKPYQNEVAGCKLRYSEYKGKLKERTPKINRDDSQDYTDHDTDISDDQQFITLSCDDLYGVLNQTLITESAHSTQSGNNLLSMNELMNYCETLSDVYPAKSCCQILEKLPMYFDQPDLSADNLHVAAVTVLNTILTLLGKFAGHSFQEMIAMKSQEVVPHFKLFCCVFSLQRRQVQLHLKTSDAVMYKVFRGRDFQNNVIVQMIDVLYALLLPKEWGSPYKISSEAYNLLCEIRNEMGHSLHLTEEFSNAIIKFPCQTWRKTNMKAIAEKRWYVSSVDSTDLEMILRGDIPLGGNKISRLSIMKKNCPRREINAIWGMFAWFSDCTKAPNSNGNVRWRLISSLYTYQAGSLSHYAGTAHQFPPSPSQLKSLQDELKRFDILLRSGHMEPLPHDDGILGSILYRALLLYGEREHYLDIAKSSKPISQRASRLAYDVWKESDISNVLGKDVASHNFLSCRLLTECADLSSDDLHQFSLLSRDDCTLVAILNFLKGWLDRITKKKARWSRLGDTISKVADKLSNISSNIKTDTDQPRNDQSGDIDAVFSSVFANAVGDSTNENSRGISLKCALTNAIVLMYVLVLKSLSANGVEVEAHFPVKFDLGFCQKVWTSMADKSMQQRQFHLMARSSSVEINVNHISSISNIYITMKTVSIVLFTILDETDCRVQNEVDSCDKDMQSTTESDLAYMLTCMLTLVTFTCDHLRASAGKLFPGPMVSIQYNSEGLVVLNVMACGLLWLSCIVHKMISILYKNQSMKCPTLSAFKDASNHFLSRAFHVILDCLKIIPSCAVEKGSSGTCYRLCLSLLRNTIHLFWVCHKIHTIREEPSSFNNEHANLNPSDTHNSTDYQELFGGIDDDVLMSIDLDRLLESDSTQRQESTHVDIDSYGAKEIWNLLIDTLDKAKPSTRFKLEQTFGTVRRTKMEFTHHGKATCALHAAGICGVLSSFCAVQEANDTTRDNVNSMAELRFWQHALSTSVENDKDFFYDVRRCICSELCHIAKYSANCKELIYSLSGGIILRTFLNSAANASTINLFPSTNKKVLVQVGGKESLAEEENLIVRTRKKLKSHKMSTDLDNGYLIDPHPSDYYDTPGPSYMASHFWSFCSDLGNLLQSTNKDVSLTHEALVLKRVGMALLYNDYDLDPSLKKISNEALESMPKLSLERECFKRIVKLRSIISACFADESVASPTASHKQRDQNSMLDFDILSTLVLSLIKELSYLLTGVEYYENNPLSVKPHTKAKIHVLFHAYSHLTSSFLTWLLCHLSNDQVKDLFDLVFRYLIIPILRCKGFYHINELFRGARMMMKGNFSDIFESSAPSSTNVNQTTSSILLLTLTHYMDRIVNYACLSKEDHSLYQIMTCFEASDQESLQKNIFVSMAFIEGIERHVLKGEVNLVGSIELYFSLVRANNGAMTNGANTSIKRFRIFAIRSFLLPKLKHESVRLEKKINLLLTLLHIIDIQRVKKSYDTPKPLYISTENDDDDFYLSLELDVVEIVSGIFISLHRSFIARNVNSSIIKYSFECLRCLFTMKVTGGTSTLMAWSIANQEKNHIASKIQDHMKIFLLLSRIMTSHQLNLVIEHYEAMNFERNHEPSLFEKYKDMVSNVMAKDHVHLDRFPNPQNYYTNQNIVPQPTAMGSTDQSLNDETREVLLSFQSYFAA